MINFLPFIDMDLFYLLQEIHGLITSLKFSGIEIKTAHSLESWSGGVLVMVSGSVQTKQFSGWRRFVQTFFLAPQEKGYFILNDIFQLLDEEQVHQQQASMSVHNNFNSNINNATSAPEPGMILRQSTLFDGSFFMLRLRRPSLILKY